MQVRPTCGDDIPGLRAVVDGTALFPGEMLQDMVQGFLRDPDSADLWFTCEQEGETVGFCYAVPEELADGTWNMLAIAVLPAEQGKGYGAALVSQLEAELRTRGQRILIVETSGNEGFAQTRAFYRKNGYSEEARIRDFWAKGDDKVVFWKSLTETS